MLAATQAPTDNSDDPSNIPPPSPDNVRPEFARSLPRFDDISMQPDVLATNLGLAGFMLMLLILSSEIFNQTVEENDAEIKRMLRKYLRPVLAVGEALGDVFHAFFSGKGVAGILGPGIVLVIAGTIYGFSEPNFGFNERSLVMFLGIALTIGILTYWYDGGQVLMARRFGVESAIRLFPIGVFVAIGAVALNRIEGFNPGIIFGFIAAAVILGDRKLSEDEEGQVIFFPALSLMVLATIAWLLVYPFRDLATDNPDSVFATLPEMVAVGIFVGAIEGVFFQLIPMRFMDGHKVWSWNKGAWLVLAGFTGFLFWHVLLNKERSSFGALGEAMPLTAMILMSVVFGLTLAVWLYFRFRGSPQHA